MSIVKEGWVIKRGGSIQTWKKRWLVLRGNTLYYFKKKEDTQEQGSIRLEPGMKVREEKNCKKSPFAFMVETPGRQYLMYPANKSSQENSAWEKAINNVLNPGSSAAKSSSVPQVSSINKPMVTSNNNNVRADDKFSASARADRDDSLVGRLMFSKGISPFLQAQDTQMCEFWNLWYNTVSQQLSEDATCDIMFDFSYSEDFNKLYWNSAGPQYLMIQQLVDFFYIVGAPEEEIEKLNVVGESINPDRIGSWINVSEKGGIDGGWCFTFPINLEVAINSVEQGLICEQIKKWGRTNGVQECFYLARDMGAEPPRQTEIRCRLEPGGAWEQAQLMYDLAGFPYPPNDVINVVKTAEEVYVAVNITEEEFVRVAVGIENPDSSVVRKFGNSRTQEVEAGLGPVTVIEFQYLKQDFGYSVYKEGYDVHVGYHIE